ncbi:MAG: TonB-dependent receptor [Spirochaetaceae bacterium]|nr:TonB-dependent receptor [Spirochaetaceae bacterium]MCF7950988.1 TonB-dependent receptor [Spirochaetaceae bacterium]
MNKLKRSLTILMLISIASATYALPIRSITTLGVDQYQYDNNTNEIGYTLGEVAIAQLESGLSLVAKAEYEEMADSSELKGMAGVVFPTFSFSYMETSYGISLKETETEETLIHHLLADLYYERDRYMILGGLKAELSSAQQTLLPSIGARWNWTPRLSLWGKYTTSFNSEDGFNHSLWTETEYGLTKKLFGKIGATVGSYSNEVTGDSELEYSVLGGFAVKPASTVRLSYQYEFLVRKSYEKGSHTLVADIRF